jgi:ParB-like chromosome segregation protein Spo0J
VRTAPAPQSRAKGKGTGRKKSKTGLKMCSDAMRDWKTGHPTGQTWATLARCRALARGRSGAPQQRGTPQRKAEADTLRKGRTEEIRNQTTDAVAKVRSVRDRLAKAKEYRVGREATRGERLNRLYSKMRSRAERMSDQGATLKDVGYQRHLDRQIAVKDARDKGITLRDAAQQQRDRVAARKATPQPAKQDTYGPGFIGRMPVGSIKADPGRFQYKSGLTDAKTGTTEALKDVRSWNEELAGVVSVWKDPASGQTYVINGHHRLALAQRFGVKDLPVRFIDSPNDVQARAKGALQNIAEGRGTPLDAAKFFRDTKIDKTALEQTGLSMREKQVDTALGAAKVAGPVWQEVYNERLPIEHAAMIGNADLPGTSQISILKDLQARAEKGKATSAQYIKEAIDDELHAPSKTETSASLFGDVQEDRKLTGEARELRANIFERLSRDKRIFGSVTRNADRLETGGNVIDRETSKSLASESGTNAEAFQAWKRHPQIKAVIDRTVLAAEGIKGKDRKKVEDEGFEEIIKRIRRLLAS